MAAILQCKGAICTYGSVRRNWDYMRGISSADFVSAATMLQTLEFGIYTNADPEKKNQQFVFIKKEPEEVVQVLSENPDLCDYYKYEDRYHQPPSKAISLALKANLVKQNLISEKALQ